MLGRNRVAALAGLSALLALAAFAAPASATFHEMSIREVYPGSVEDSYVELQMRATGQNLVGGHALTLYGATGALTGTFTFPGDLPNGPNQQTILIGDTGVANTFNNVTPDLVDANLNVPAAGGAVCWAGTIDCMAWGSFSPSSGFPVGAPADPFGIPAGMALRRTIAPGCATLLESSDDTDSSAADFSDAFPNPRSDASAPSERSCSSGGGGGSGGGAPQTSFRRRPQRRTRDRTPTFRFSSSESGSSFECKLDRRPFVVCYPPYTTQRLRLGRHTLKVRARDSSGKVDPSPASYAFKVVRRRR